MTIAGPHDTKAGETATGRGGGGHRLAENVVQFVRILRASGLAVGPASTRDAVESICVIDMGQQAEMYHALAACLVKRPEDRHLFDQAFHMFWRNPNLRERVRDMLLPTLGTERAPPPTEDIPLLRRLQEAMKGPADNHPETEKTDEDRIEIDAALTWSAQEKFQSMDFQMMSVGELQEAERVIDQLAFPFPVRPSRRFCHAPSGARYSMRRTMQSAARRGGLHLPVAEKPVQTLRPVVVICDISGSMERYSRMLLRFTHSLTQHRGRVHSFLFGTRLTNITRHMRNRDADAALKSIALQVQDWSGGTRISSALAAFNQDWSRRVLGQGAILLLITDGLDRDPDGDLSLETDRLHKSCSHLIWLNPLLRFDGFEPRSTAVQAILPHVDAFFPVHSLASLGQLTQTLNTKLPVGWRDGAMSSWLGTLSRIETESKLKGI